MIIESGHETAAPRKNTIIGEPVLDNSIISFNGNNNILFTEEGVTLSDSRVVFGGDSAVMYLSADGHPYRLVMDVYRECTVWFGKGNYFNGPLHAVASERKNILVGGDGLFSFGVWIRTADPHLIFRAETGERINLSASVWIGDHVWLGQNSLILKGTSIGSGSILSAGAVAAGKSIGSNSIYGGNPARRIRKNIFWLGDSVHNYTAEQSAASLKRSPKNRLYGNGSLPNLPMIDRKLSEATDAETRLALLRKYLADNTEKDRLFIPSEPGPSVWRRLIGK